MTIRVDRLRTLATHLRSGKLGHKVFDFSVLNVHIDGGAEVEGCGTNGCAMGELPICFPKEWEFARHRFSYRDSLPALRDAPEQAWYTSVEEFFDILPKEMAHLFNPGEQLGCFGGVGYKLDGSATKDMVAEHIEKFCDWVDAGQPHLPYKVLV